MLRDNRLHGLHAPTRLLGVLLLCTALALLLSCSGDAAGVATPCSTDEECSEGRCVAGFCTTTPDDGGDSDSAALLPPSETTSTSQVDVDISTGPGTGLGDYLDPCVRGADCRSGICISSPIGRVCTRLCSFDEECEEAAGWRCQFVQGDRDLVQICYPDPADLCEPCSVDTDCGGLNDRCVPLENGTFCGLDCRTGSRCPEGYQCVDNQEEGWVQCLPEENRCGDCRFADTTNDPFHCGECDRVCEFERGQADCVNGECILTGCDVGWGNCDGDPETGCETDLRTDVDNCGECGRICPGTEGIPVCTEGECGISPCASDEIFCDGDCVTPNACGGCATLDATPEVDACGACDTGTWQCGTDDAVALVCEGATDPLSDDENCGETCTECIGGQTCVAGVCTCEGGQILCEGSCADANPCGGCSTLPATPGVDDCGACDTGTWQCDGDDAEALTCEGEVDPGSNDGFCGEACIACEGGQTCQDGTCACPGDQVLCAGACQDPNPCGGCTTLPATPGVDDCGACDTGTWQCDPTDAEALICDGETDPGSDDDFCGDSCTICQGGQTCQEGVCACPGDQILCAGTCRAPNACGGCDALEAAPGVDACGSCDTGTWQCDPGDPNDLECVGATDPQTDSDNCGTGCVNCTGGQTCQGGVCACPGDDILCAGTCRAPNACGGCDALEAAPGVDACGSCDTGTWQCISGNPNALECVGATNPQTDSDNCGTGCVNCTGGQTCQGGVCACPADQILCDGVCRTPNVCGGCPPLGSIEPGDACGSCGTGTQACTNVGTSSATLVCEGATSTNSDPQNCGSCGNVCPSGASCVGGSCQCPGGQIVCNGACQDANACNGCADLGGQLPDDSCQNCGVLTCSSGSLVCSGQTNTNTDPSNCGTCGNSCGTNEICSGGDCVCATGFTRCGGACVALGGTCGQCGNGTEGCVGGSVQCVGATTDACGACNLGRSVGDTCQTCGTWACNAGGPGWTCANLPDFSSDPNNCGSCGTVCTGGRICSGGSCTCPGNQFFCGGQCRTPEPCGLCGNGTEGCVGGAVQCIGASTNSCGGCNTLSPPVNALCGPCNLDRYQCASETSTQCDGSTTNACGGCNNIGQTPGNTCSGCGSWTCQGNSLNCVTPDFNTDTNNCGGCGITCNPGDACSGGQCVCNTGRDYDRVWIRNQSLQFGALTTFLQGEGYTVTRSQGGLFTSTLTSQDILVIDSSAVFPGTSPTPQAVFDFVNGGGSVIFIGGNSALMCERLNPYLNVFGMRLSDVGNTTGACSGGSFSSNTNLNLSISAHPVTRNASLSNANLAQRNGWRIRDIGGNSDRVVTLNNANNREVLRARQVGCGRVLVLADERIATDMESGNQLFWRQAMQWLAFDR